MKENIHWFKPFKISNPWSRQHGIQLRNEEGAEVGYGSLIYFSRPKPLYLLSHLGVYKKEDRNQRRASRILDEYEASLKEKGVIGLLEDAVDPNSEASGMYARREWKLIAWKQERENAQYDLYAFNLPEDIDVRAFVKEFDKRRLARYKRMGKQEFSSQ